MCYKILVKLTGELIRYVTQIQLQKCSSTNVTLVRIAYECIYTIDIRDLISLDDVQEELKYGPNGGLVYCMEYLVENIDWLMEELQEFADESFILFDCPGQIELYSHLDVMTRLTKEISKAGFLCCAVYCADGTFINEPSKYVSACFTYYYYHTQLIQFTFYYDLIELTSSQCSHQMR